MSAEEQFEVVDAKGQVVGLAPRSECHGNPSLIHRAVHVIVVDETGRLFLQKRAACKDIQPGKWDTSVGGHVQPGEPPGEAARREMAEELGVVEAPLTFLYEYVWRTKVETELVQTFSTSHNGPFILHPEEIDEGRFWITDEIEAALGSGCFTPNFEVEFERFRTAKRKEKNG